MGVQAMFFGQTYPSIRPKQKHQTEIIKQGIEYASICQLTNFKYLGTTITKMEDAARR